MRGYEPRIRGYASKMEKLIRTEGAGGCPIDMNSAINRFAYSTMFDFTFGREADEDDQEWQAACKTIHTGLALMGPLTPAPWIALLAFSFTGLRLVRDWKNMLAYCRSKMHECIATEEKEAAAGITMTASKMRQHYHLSSLLIGDARKRGKLWSPEEMRWLDGDAFTAILAGSDTTGSTLVFAFWHLARNAAYQARVYDELKAVQSQAVEADVQLSHLDFRHLERLNFLNALINETLRLHHPLPSAGSRIVRDKGLVVGGRFIPPGTNVSAPRWSFGRQEAHFVRADEFLPERWVAGAGGDGDDFNNTLVSDRRAFQPFGSDKWSCLGKQIALFELRYLIALLVWNYTISLPPGDDGSSVLKDYKDQATAFPGQLNLVFTPRSC